MIPVFLTPSKRAIGMNCQLARLVARWSDQQSTIIQTVIYPLQTSRSHRADNLLFGKYLSAW